MNNKKKANIFILKFIGIIAAYYFLISLTGTEFLSPYITITVKIAGLILSIFESGIYAANSFLTGAGNSLNLAYGCDGSDQFIVFLAAVVSFPVASKMKWKGIMYGLPLLYLVNVFRIIALYYVAKNDMGNFELYHVTIFPTIFIIISIAFWFYWMNWTKTQNDI